MAILMRFIILIIIIFIGAKGEAIILKNLDNSISMKQGELQRLIAARKMVFIVQVLLSKRVTSNTRIHVCQIIRINFHGSTL